MSRGPLWGKQLRRYFDNCGSAHPHPRPKSNNCQARRRGSGGVDVAESVAFSQIGRRSDTGVPTARHARSYRAPLARVRPQLSLSCALRHTPAPVPDRPSRMIGVLLSSRRDPQVHRSPPLPTLGSSSSDGIIFKMRRRGALGPMEYCFGGASGQRHGRRIGANARVGLQHPETASSCELSRFHLL